MTWTQTYSGRAVNLLRPQAADIAFEDVAHHLAYAHRFNGAIEYTNAQHSILVASIVWQVTKSEEATIHGLLHDGHEAPMGDVIGPLRAALKVLIGDAFKQALGLITSNIDAAIREAFNLDKPSDEIVRQVVSADQRALFIERAMFLAPPPAPWPLELSSYEETHRVALGDLDVEWNRTILTHAEAEQAFTWAFDELRHRLGRGPAPSWVQEHRAWACVQGAFNDFQR
jgi:hypothetical protein